MPETPGLRGDGTVCKPAGQGEAAANPPVGPGTQDKDGKPWITTRQLPFPALMHAASWKPRAT
jgi:hypothetical protein